MFSTTNLIPVTLKPKNGGDTYTYYLDKACLLNEDIDVFSKKIGIALKSLISRLNLDIPQGSARIRAVTTTEKDYTFFIEYNDVIEVHKNISIPSESESEKFTAALTADPISVDAVDLDVIKNSPALAQYKGPVLRLEPLKILKEEIKADKIFTAEERSKTLNTSPRLKKSFEKLTTLSERHTDIQQSLATAEEARDSTNTAIETLKKLAAADNAFATELNMHSDRLRTQAQELADIKIAITTAKEQADNALFMQCQIYTTNENTHKQLIASLSKVLRRTALEYYQELLAYHKASLPGAEKTKFNTLFKNIATITDSLPSEILRFDSTLTTKDLLEIENITQNIIATSNENHNKKMLRVFRSQSELFILTNNLKNDAPLNSQYVLTPDTNYPTVFQWKAALSNTQTQTPTTLDSTIVTLEKRMDEAYTQITTSYLALKKLNNSTRDATQQIQTDIAQLQELKMAAHANKTQFQNLLNETNTKIPTASLHYQEAIRLATQLEENTDVLNKFPKAIDKHTHTLKTAYGTIERNFELIMESKNHTEARGLFETQKQACDAFTKNHTRLTGLFPAIENEKNRLQAKLAAKQQAELVAANEAEEQQQNAEAQQLLAEQQAALATQQAAEKEDARKALVLDAVKKIISVMAEALYWHTQVTFGGSPINDPLNPGKSIKVPKWNSEMTAIKEQDNLTIETLNYDQAEKFMSAIKAKAGEAMTRKTTFFCCYNLRKPSSTNMLDLINDFDVKTPITTQALDQTLTTICPTWKTQWDNNKHSRPSQISTKRDSLSSLLDEPNSGANESSRSASFS